MQLNLTSWFNYEKIINNKITFYVIYPIVYVFSLS
jgi:hypothetical protein